ncbi:MAG: hypothetical protein M3Z11_12030 [Candidatus Dormibacteraeota bacterium]|nr:hypothetical protein [Candidatus Dormibacteraeota bacterium]
MAELEPEVAPVTQAEPEVAPVTEAEPEVAPVPAREPEVAPVPAGEPEIAPVPAREPEAGAVAAVAAAPGRRSTSRRRTGVWLLPAAAAAVLAVLLALPVAGWFKAAGREAVSPQLPLTAGLSATASATPTPTPAPTEAPTPSAAPTPAQPAAQPPTIQPPADAQPVPVPAFPTTAGDPSSAIGSFYQAVAAHQFDAAAATWSGRMQANYPPAEFINRRFAYTQQMNLRAARTIANNGQVAMVSIDLIEVYAGSQRHWAGTWEMVRSSSGWLLNQPNLRAAG